MGALEAAVALLQEQRRRLTQRQWEHLVERDEITGLVVKMHSIPVYPS